MSNFDRAFAIVVSIESGLSIDARDPGNWTGGEVGRGKLNGTKYGISAARYPQEDILNLTIDRAKTLYQRDYWNPQGCEHMEWGKALLVFDCAVNGGHPQRWHDMYAGETMENFAVDFQAEHIQYLASLKNWPTEARGWARRLLKIFRLSQASP